MKIKKKHSDNTDDKQLSQAAFVASTARRIRKGFSTTGYVDWLDSELQLPGVGAHVHYELFSRRTSKRSTQGVPFVPFNTFTGRRIEVPFITGELLLVGSVIVETDKGPQITDCVMSIILHVHTGSRERFRSWAAQAWGYYQTLHKLNCKEYPAYPQHFDTLAPAQLLDVGLVTKIMGQAYSSIMAHAFVVNTVEPCVRAAGMATESGYGNDNVFDGATGHIVASFLHGWTQQAFGNFLGEAAARLLTRYVEERKLGYWR